MTKAIQKFETKQLAGIFFDKESGGWNKSLSRYSTESKTKDVLVSAMILFDNSWQLAECMNSEQGRTSIYNTLKVACRTGLSLNPMDNKATITAYKNNKGFWTCNYQIMKDGLIEKAQETGLVKFITAEIVREKDSFSMSKTHEGDKYSFEYNITDRGKRIGAFAAMIMKTGEAHCCYMTWEQIQEHNDMYSKTGTDSSGKKNESRLNKFPDGWAKKTVLRSLLTSAALGESDASLDGYESTETIEETGAEIAAELIEGDVI
jgi:phage RecT family recombinase